MLISRKDAKAQRKKVGIPLRLGVFARLVPHGHERWGFLLLLFLAILLFFLRLPCGLLEPEEARYSEIARQMLEQDRWLTPTLHGEDYLHKPPLLYWLIMLSYRLFGVHDWAARLVLCLGGVGVVGACYFWARAALGRRSAFCAALALLLSARFLYLQGMLLFDGLLCLWVTLGWAFGHMAFKNPRFSWPCWMASTAACSLGVLTKGPVAAALIGPPLLFAACGLAYTIKNRPPLWRLASVYGLTTALLCIPWFAYLLIQHPDAAREFFLLHHLQRYVDPFDHAKPWWFYLAPLILGMLPWSLWGLPALREGWKSLASRGMQATLSSRTAPFWIAGGWCLLFFSLSGCKRPAYILPAFGPLAIGLGYHIGRTQWFCPRRQGVGLSDRAGGMVGAVLTILLAGTAIWLPAYHARFGMREAISALRQERNLPIHCYPRQWDSVSFYTQGPVREYEKTMLADLLADMGQHDRSWLIVRRRDGLAMLTEHWPTHLQLHPQAPEHANVLVALVIRGRQE